MNEQEMVRVIQELSQKVDKVQKSTEKIRNYLLASLVISIVVFVLPLIGLIIAIPSFLENITAVSNL